MSLSKERWEYLKALKPAAPRYIHVSKDAKMIPAPSLVKAGTFHADNPLHWIPWVAPRGVTYNMGFNKKKRENRLAKQR